MSENRTSMFQQYIAPVLVGITIAVMLGIFNWVVNTDRIITELKTQYKIIDIRLINIEKKLEIK